jgi:NADPH:quinone reductase-like Zn-dependent oxidoreductase
MKAAVYRRYGPPDVIEITDIEQPVPTDDKVLIKVRAASVNPHDWHFMRGTPYFVRMMAGLCKPDDTRLGIDVAGEVEAIGRNVMQFKPGDQVFGSCRGAFAEYACASESALAEKPGNLTFEQAASVPAAALTALQGLRDKGQLQHRQQVLINGAAGGVGTFAVQIAKSFGADVTGVCSTRNVDMVRAIGGDHVIDYLQEDFTEGAQRYDLILDCVGNRSFSKHRHILNPRGISVGVGAPSGRWMIGPLVRAIAAPVVLRFASQKLVTMMTKPSQQDLAVIRELIEAGTIIPVIDRCYRLCEVPEAVRYVEKGHTRGKVVVTVAG